MHVVATAGHVDHGKSALVRALTGMEPDRWAEERRRGMTIDLGFAWTTLPSGTGVAFVDVPGHDRFVTNMLAGVGAVPAVVVVVAGDEGWMPQTEEHVAAIDALGVAHGLAVVTKADLGGAEATAADVRTRLARTRLHAADVVIASAATGEGVEALRSSLDAMLATVPAAPVDAPVRLWVDRAFTVAGAGTVVTGTLGAGRISLGDDLLLAPSGRRVTVRGLESQHVPVATVAPTARVAVNLRGVDRGDVRRGMALATPGAWAVVDEVDVVAETGVLAGDVVVHAGSAAVPARVRVLGPRAARLRLALPLPMHVGDRLLLRDPGRRLAVGADVADLEPQPFRRRGDAARVVVAVPATADAEVRRRGVTSVDRLRAAGLTGDTPGSLAAGRWRVSPTQWEEWCAAVQALVATAVAPVPFDVVRRRLDLPDLDLVPLLAGATDGVVTAAGAVRAVGQVDAVPVEIEPLVARLTERPFDAPDGEEVRRLGGDVLARAVRSGVLVHVGAGVYLTPTAPARAADLLAALDQPFTVSAARQALGATRRVVVPVLEHLDAARVTRRLDDGTRLVVGRQG